jgi:hypothetical protein
VANQDRELLIKQQMRELIRRFAPAPRTAALNARAGDCALVGSEGEISKLTRSPQEVFFGKVGELAPGNEQAADSRRIFMA